MYLAIKTNDLTPEIYLLDKTGNIIQKESWQNNYNLAYQIPGLIDKLVDKDYNKLSGVIAFKGGGSFTGLRIGLTIANTIADANNINIVGVSGEKWLKDGLALLAKNINHQLVLPDYQREANITKPKK